MGRSKALAKIHGVSLIRRTIGVLAPFAANPIIIVTPPRARRMSVELRGLPVRLVANPARAFGLSSSVIRALQASRFSAATLLLPVDLAELAPHDIARLISRWRSAQRRLTARRIGDRLSTPLILPRSLYARAREITGDVGLRDLLAGSHIEDRTLVELPSAERDADTPHDLQDARRSARYRSLP
jgi:CTP:molybdopterin cytidylyltransferase MocA